MLREEAFILAGRVARYTGGGLLGRAITSPDNVRIVLSHEVPAEYLQHYRDIVRYVTSKRRVITPQEFFGYYNANGDRMPIRGQAVLFTFDDGLLSSYHAAKHVLRPLGIKAIFFVPTQILELEHEEEMRRFAWEQINHRVLPIESLRPEQYLTMTRSELLELRREGHAILPHTHSHTNISEIATLDDVEAELRRPKMILEDLLQTSCDAFAFPVGNERVVSAYSFHKIAQIYDYCFWSLTGANTEKTHPLLLRRDSIHPWHSLGHVRNIVGGTYDAYHGLRQSRIRRRLDLTALPTHDRATVSKSPSNGTPSGRPRFIEAVGRELKAAGVDHVFLHGYEPDHGADSDVDIAVGRQSVALVDATIRTGVFGRLLQCLHYADPWCRYYVVAADEPGRRYRELDVACDPWGIGKDGPALRVALAHAVDAGGIRVPAPAAHTLYLAIKKARKRQTGEGARDLLLSAYARDPRGSSELLERYLGHAGRDLAHALEAQQESLRHELEAVRRRLLYRWLSPPMLARRVAFGTWRSFRRFFDPTGLVVCITGPDGAGKSTLAANLEHATRGPFRRLRRYHLRPGLLPPPARLLRRRPTDSEMPHGRKPSGLGGSLLRLLYLWLDTLVGWIPRIRIPQIRSTLVVLERGWLDLIVDPYRYRLSSPTALTRLLGRVLPRPSIVLRLEGPGALLAGRKPELDTAETTRQLEAWRRLATADHARFFAIDASRPPTAVLERALDAIDDRLASRQHELRSCELALACLGDLRVGGKPYRIIFAPRGPLRRGPRWVLPRRRGAPGPRGSQLFRPARLWHHGPALALELVQRVGLRQIGTRVTLATERGAGPLIADALGLREVELGAAVTGDRRRGGRALLTVSHEGRLVAFAKVAREEGAKLEHERRILDLLASSELRTLIVPEVVGFIEWRDCKILLLKPFPVRHRANRPLGPAEFAGLAELSGLSKSLSPVLGEHPHLVPVHGDFAPWNCAPKTGSRLTLWDWEEAKLGLPLEDIFYWRLQRLLRFGHGTVADLVLAALEPAEDVTILCERLSISPATAPDALRMCLDKVLQARGIADAGPPPATVPALERAVEELSESGASR